MFTELLRANATYADGFALAHLIAPPQRQLAVVTCMDTRIDPLAVLGLRPGDAHILRNAGGRVSDDVLRSLLVSTHVLGVCNIVVMHHTDCGMASVEPDQLRQLVGDVPEEDWQEIDLLAIDDGDRALRDDVERVRRSALLPEVAVVGWVYDVASGRVREVVGAPAGHS